MYDPVKAIFNVTDITELTVTTPVVCYTAPNAWSYVHKVHLSNTSTLAIQVTIEVRRGGTSYVWCLEDLGAKSCQDYVMDFELSDGDEIRVTAATANEITAFVVVSEARGRSA